MKIVTTIGLMLLVIGTAFLFMLGMWCLDTSVSCLLSGGIITNGFITPNPAKTYHMGLVLMIALFALNTLTLAYLVLKREGLK